MKKRFLLFISLLLILILAACKSNHLHTFILHPEHEASCLEEGNDMYYTCKNCDMIFDAYHKHIDSIPVIEKKPHSYVHHDAISPTYNIVGSIEHYTCINCGKYFDTNYSEIDKSKVFIDMLLFNAHIDSKMPRYIDEDGNVYLDIKNSEFLSHFTYGDYLYVSILNNTYILPVCYEAGNVDSGRSAIVSQIDKPDAYVMLCVNSGSFASSYNIAKKTSEGWQADFDTLDVDISLSEHQGYLDKFKAQYLSNISTNRGDYPTLSDSDFANFRVVENSKFGKNRLFRSSSPLNASLARYDIVFEMIKKSGINVIFNFDDSFDMAESIMAYFDTYYSNQDVSNLNFDNVFTNEFDSNMLAMSRKIASCDGMYLVHCDDGLDKTGYVVAILEAYMDIPVDDIIYDYMLSYCNLYNVSDDSILYSMLAHAFKISFERLLGGSISKENATRYLKSIGVSDLELDLITSHLSTDSTVRKIYNYRGINEPIFLFGRDLEIEYDLDMKFELEWLCDDIISAIKAGVMSYDGIYTMIERVLDIRDILKSDSTNITILADAYGTEEKYDLQTEIESQLRNISIFINEMNVEFASSVYRSEYYYGYTDEEISKIVDDIDIDGAKELDEILKNISDVKTSYYGGNYSSLYDLVYYLSTLNNEYAVKLGYDNYLAYSYERLYGREYSVDDVSVLSSYMESYIAPIMSAYNAAYNSFVSKLSRAEVNSINYVLNSKITANLDTFDDYAEFIGGEYEENYYYLWDSGNYFFSDVVSNSTTAYTLYGGEEIYLFFSGGYQGYDTFIHEFGHYNANMQKTYIPLDLAEVHSQGNEMLYHLYLSSLDDVSEKLVNGMTLISLDSIFRGIKYGILISLMEKYIFTDETATADNLQSYWEGLCDTYGFTDIKSYNWSYAVVTSPGYYISYATSALSALDIFALGCSDLDVAVEKYKSIYSYPGRMSYTEVMDYTGLLNPFTNAGYEEMLNNLTEYFDSVA